MIINGNKFTVNKKSCFNGSKFEYDTNVTKAFEFAYDMSFGGKGKHRTHRSGGEINRKKGEIFINTFQGKLAELAFYEFFSRRGFEISFPDFDTYDLGVWDSADFEVKKDSNTYLFSIKSTKYYGDLMLLETKDYNKNGEYIPNIGKDKCKYDYFSLVRIYPDSESLMKSKKLLYSNECDRAKLEELILSQNWKYDVPGYITNQNLIDIINNNSIIPKNAILNEKTRMDAENYYIETGNLIKFKNICE